MTVSGITHESNMADTHTWTHTVSRRLTKRCYVVYVYLQGSTHWPSWLWKLDSWSGFIWAPIVREADPAGGSHGHTWWLLLCLLRWLALWGGGGQLWGSLFGADRRRVLFWEWNGRRIISHLRLYCNLTRKVDQIFKVSLFCFLRHEVNDPWFGVWLYVWGGLNWFDGISKLQIVLWWIICGAMRSYIPACVQPSAPCSVIGLIHYWWCPDEINQARVFFYWLLIMLLWHTNCRGINI